MYPVPARPTMPGPPEIPRPGESEWTDYERSLDPVFDQTLQEEVDERNKIQPLRKILDLLSRGQYVSANVATHITEQLQGKTRDQRTFDNVLHALYTGVTGEVKGSYSDYLRDTLNVGHGKVFENAPEERRRSQWDWADIIGFAADVLLDPLTYIGGPTKSAVGTARSFADDAVRVAARQLSQNPEDLAKITRTFTSEAVEGLARRARPGQSIHDVVGGALKQSDDLGRYFSQLYNDSYRHALSRTAPELADEMLTTIDDVGGEGLEDLILRISDADKYSGAGQRSVFNFFGKEIGSRGPSPIRRGWEQFASRFVKAKPGESKFRNAVWGAFNRGPVGALRQMFGFRNPYQKSLRAIELEEGPLFIQDAAVKNVERAKKAVGDIPETVKGDVFETFMRREQINVSEAGAPLWRRSNKTGIVSEEADEAADRVEQVLEDWFRKENEWASELGYSEFAEREHYLPIVSRDRTSATPGFRKPREYTLGEHVDKETNAISFIFNTDQKTAERIVRDNLGGISTDLDHILATRAIQHARMEGQVNLFRQLKEFGIDMSDKADELAGALGSRGKQWADLGLEEVNHPAFEGYLFDSEVADVIKRTIRATGKEKNQFRKAFDSYMNWWRGIVTATPGFHMRNFQSNTMSQYIKHGMRVFDFDLTARATAGVSYALAKSNPERFLKGIGADESWMNKMLTKYIGDRDIKDLAEIAARKGVISESLMGFDPQDIVTRASRAAERESMGIGGKVADSLRPSNQPVRSASRWIGARVENVPRFKSFLIDYGDMIKSGASDEVAIDYAVREAKKWFLDYTDLTDFERNVMKNIIPFYSWIRKNLPNQMEALVKYPGTMATVADFQRLMEYEDDSIDPSVIPDWLKQQGAFPVGMGEDGARFYRPDFAFQDLNMIPLLWEEGRLMPSLTFSELKNDLISSTSPWVRELASRMTTENGYNYFYRSDLEETGEAPYLFRLMASNPQSIAFIDGFMRMIGYEDGAELHLDENGMLQMDGQLAQTLNDWVPVIRQAEMLFYMPDAIGVPGLLEVIEKATNAKPSHEGAEQALQALSYYMGVKMKDIDLEREGERLLQSVYYQARDIYRDMQQTQPTAQTRPYSRVNESIRRLNAH